MFTSLSAILVASFTPAIDAPPFITRLPPCRSSTDAILEPCVQPLGYSPDEAITLIGQKDEFWRLDGDALTMIARPKQGWAMLCCGIQTPLEPIAGTDLAGIAVRVPRISEAFFDVGTAGPAGESKLELVRGADAPRAPPISKPLIGKTEPFAIQSRILGETRRGTVYIPPAVPRGARLPVIYLADGAVLNFAPILEAAIREGRATPTIIVGIDTAQGTVKGCTAPCDRRGLEYLIDWNLKDPTGDSPFGRHLRFVTDELIPYIDSHYPSSPRREDRLTSGYSNGAAWALAAAEMRPDVFGKVLAMSSGSKAVASYASRLKDAYVYAGAGLLEGGTMHQRTREAATAAHQAGAEVKFRELVAGHSFAMWDVLFADGIGWLLSPTRTTSR